jgi:4a-hydroxytetrahydrobiopterin dehydratase
VNTSSNWQESNQNISKTFEFNSFEEAINFMVRASQKISLLNHHPEWTNIYNKVMVKLSTHDAGNTVTEKDWELARVLDGIFVDMFQNY